MSVVRFFSDPFTSFDDFDRWVDNVYQSFPAEARNGNKSHGVLKPFRPRLDLHENKESNLITATFELPGLTKENVHIDLHDGNLVVSGETTSKFEDTKEDYTVRERRFGKFSRALALPKGTKAEEVKAAMEDGVLTVTFPKTSAEQAPAKIAIA